ncbi:hypothetical protein AMATHDRAFT_4147 [Amanita thiersii Skay4041]|uniref:Uncharacterized protein n=1 Tax=Amanita thiersii Skay4041 TaxID=703135 RepID=A0A2A9NJI2_9AGAR|nr:hypothetical protein AMATHDRAFT_4147 [Amanita thiersii Skay4041]
MPLIEDKLEQYLASSTLLTEDPLRIFAIAIPFAWEDVIKKAALNTLAKPLKDMVYVEELEHITGMDLCLLVDYRFRCVDAVSRVVKKLNKQYLFEHGLLNQNASKSGPTRRHNTIRSYVTESLRACPRGSSITQIDHNLQKRIETVLNTFEHHESGESKARAVFKLLRGLDSLAVGVDEAVSKVTLTIDRPNNSAISTVVDTAENRTTIP